MKTFSFAALLIVIGGTVVAQRPCAGPGASFGITSYRCVSCAIQQKPGEPPALVFDAEPVVLQAEGGAFRPGDVIVSVAGHPITTRAGADAFTYPRAGITEVLVRRGGEQHTISLRQTEDCPGGTMTGIASKLVIVDGVPMPDRYEMAVRFRSPAQTPPDSNENVGRFGFTLECVPSCTRTRASDGTEYWKYDGLPRMVAVQENGPAEKAGLKVGDLVLEVNGRYILEEGGALALLNSGRSKAIMLKVRRQQDGRILTAMLKVEP